MEEFFPLTLVLNKMQHASTLSVPTAKYCRRRWTKFNQPQKFNQFLESTQLKNTDSLPLPTEKSISYLKLQINMSNVCSKMVK